jgi:diketogulonate reductase-like aldo/keto reductase
MNEIFYFHQHQLLAEHLKKSAIPKSGTKKRVVKNKNTAKIQLAQDTETIINNLSTVCEYGTKKDSKGYKMKIY